MLTNVYLTIVDDVQLSLSFLDIARLFDFAAAVQEAVYSE